MARAARLLVVLAAAGAVLGSRPDPCPWVSSAAARAPALAAPGVELETLATGLTAITAIAHTGDGRLFLTLQRGRIVIWDGSQVLPTPFLDVSGLVICCGEQGLLSTAFHPQYGRNGFFFIDYTDLTGRTIVARYRVSAGNPSVADPASAVTLLTIDQPYANHNGGQLQFGPDGFLYIGMGDGGSGNDPFCNGQSSDTLLGKLLRIDVDQFVDRPPYYGIPAGNPFVSTGGPAQAWAKGLRNPWRFAFDRLTGDLFIGDVGQSAREEIDFQPFADGGGQNYGWKIMEGTLCGGGGTAGCTMPVPPCGDPDYTPPVLEYGHDGGNCSVTGGYVYRGLSIPDLYGKYVYGDYCSGRIWAASSHSGAWSPVLLSVRTAGLTTFGEDVFGELYVGTGAGALYRVVSSAPLSPTINTVSPAAGSTRGGEIVTISGTNFTGQTRVSFGVSPAPVQVQSPTVLLAISPPHPGGLVDVIVANPGASAAIRIGGFGYLSIGHAAPPLRTPQVVERP